MSNEEQIKTKEEIKAEEKSVEGTDEPQDTLVPLETYLKAGIHIGTKFKTKYMKNFIYKIRNDGLYVLDLKKIDERIKLAAKFISRYAPEDIAVVSRRENGWRSVKQFANITGCKVFAGRYPPGLLTNTNLRDFIEVKLIIVTDPWPDRNVIEDAKKVGITILGLCDSNNQTNDLDLVLPCNNKGKKSIGLIYYLLAREYMRNRGLIGSSEDISRTQEDFTEQ